MKEIIFSIWLSVEFPGNIGFPIRIYAKMHPTLQISADLPYELEPSRTSGALYHLVATSSVKMTSWLYLSAMRDLANPKSHIFMVQSLLSRRLDGLRSRCIISAE